MITVDYLLHPTETHRDQEVRLRRVPRLQRGLEAGHVIAASTGGRVLPRSALRPGERASAGSGSLSRGWAA